MLASLEVSKNHGVDDEVDAMFDMGRETLALPLEQKMKYEQGNRGFSFGRVFGRVMSYMHS